jgi:signal transduction histidine kinase
VNLRVTKDPDLPKQFYSDGQRIQTVLVNLLNNAAKFTRDGEIQINVKNHKRLFDDREPGFRSNEIEVSVTDTGIGITEARRSTLF